MNSKTFVVAILIVIGLPFFSSAQTTADLFSQEGLSINAYHYNFFDGTWSTSYTFQTRSQDTEGNDRLSFVANSSGRELLLVVQEDKVFVENQWNSTLYLVYDFGVEVGDTITEGTYRNYVVTAVDMTTLLNGESRRAIQIRRDEWTETTYIEGIGDISNGLVPDFGDFEGNDVFVCAKIGNDLLWQNPATNGDDCDMYSCVLPIPDFEVIKSDFTIELASNSRYADDYLWDFGDGNTTSSENPTHTYQSPGCYTITLKVSNDCYDGQIEKSFATSICVNSAWQEAYTNDSIRLSLYAYDADTDYLFNSDHLYRVTDGGAQWEVLSTTTTDGEKKRILTMGMWDDKRGLAASSSGLLFTEDGGNSWSYGVDDIYYVNNLLLEGAGNAYVQRSVYLDYYYRTQDYGESWEAITVDEATGENRIFRFLYAKGSKVYAHAFRGFWDLMDYRLGVSDDGGTTWRFIEVPFDVKQFQFVNESEGFGHDGTNVWYTDDGGIEWTRIQNLTDISHIYFHSSTHGWVRDNSGVILYSDDRFETYAFSACGDENLGGVRPLSDSTAVTTRTSLEFGTIKYVFDRNEIGDCDPFVDNDGDGFSATDDCDDNNATVNPGQQEEPYNGIDDDCNSATLDDDLDQDGFVLSEDCDDDNAATNPDAEDIPNNGIDEDCDGMDQTTAIHELSNLYVSIYPNPVSEVIFIKIEGQLNYSVTLFDLNGKKMLSQLNTNSLEVDMLSVGIYLLELRDISSGQKLIERIIVE